MADAIRFWLLRTEVEKRDNKLQGAFREAAEAYANRIKIDTNEARLLVIWLRFFQEARSKLDGDALPDIDPLAIKKLLNAEQKHQANGRFVLYQEVSFSTDKGRGPIRMRTPDKKFVGRTTLEILMSPVPKGEDQVRWPYDLKWKVVVRASSSKATRARSSYDSYTEKWGGLMPVLGACLQAESKHQKRSGNAVLVSTRPGAPRMYETKITLKALAELLSERYVEISKYSSSTVRRALSGYVSGSLGRPPKAIQKPKKPSL
ncbi:hypothetical protein [Comamonas sp.]|uniref:hypothetical protein n=1 Tax=Comamonas sp. TaxID=34028 RepID=UPI0028AC8388|nr:hypothetical protein [Comamonas sp.]